MLVIDHPATVIVAGATSELQPIASPDIVRCVVCHRPFNLAAGQTAVVLKHIANGYDFTHPGQCETAAREWIFVEPGYDRPAFSSDGKRVRILHTDRADGWSAVVPAAPEQVLAGTPVLYDALQCWAAVEYRDGSHHVEGIVRPSELLREPGGAEFPEARQGSNPSIAYVRDA